LSIRFSADLFWRGCVAGLLFRVSVLAEYEGTLQVAGISLVEIVRDNANVPRMFW
jgi:hypothetical protein